MTKHYLLVMIRFNLMQTLCNSKVQDHFSNLGCLPLTTKLIEDPPSSLERDLLLSFQKNIRSTSFLFFSNCLGLTSAAESGVVSLFAKTFELPLFDPMPVCVSPTFD